MGFLLGILLALLLWIFGIGAIRDGESEVESQACAVAMDGVERCGPTMVDDGYQVPDDGDVIRVIVDNGPVSPDSQEGYEIVVDAAGTVTITETPLGASGDLPESERTAEQIVRTEEIGPEGVQGLLFSLDGCGFYYLPQSGEVPDADMPVGGSVSYIEVRLDDGFWEVSGSLLEAEDAVNFDACQAIFADQFEVTAPS